MHCYNVQNVFWKVKFMPMMQELRLFFYWCGQIQIVKIHFKVTCDTSKTHLCHRLFVNNLTFSTWKLQGKLSPCHTNLNICSSLRHLLWFPLHCMLACIFNESEYFNITNVKGMQVSFYQMLKMFGPWS